MRLTRRETTAGIAAIMATGGSDLRARPLSDVHDWQVLPTEPHHGKQDDIFFADADHGWYGNGKGQVFATSDSGRQWALLWEKPGTYVRALGFIDPLVGILGNIGVDYFPGVTDAKPLYRTIDGGRSWRAVTEIAGPTPKGICAIDVLREPFINAGVLDTRVTVRAGGRVGGPAHLLTSHDLGAKWICQDLGQSTGAILDIKFINERVGFIAGASDPDVDASNAVILRTLDGGASWSRVYRSSRPFEIIWKLSFPSRRTGFATVQNYDPDPKRALRIVARTLDGGATWHELPLAIDHRLQEFGIGFVDELHGWVGGAPGGYETTDGGRSWRPADLGKATNKIRVMKSVDGVRVFAIGYDVRRLDIPAVDRPKRRS